MDNSSNNPIFRYSFILYLCIALLIAQTSGLHLHVQHDDHASSASKHNIHIASTHHDNIDTHQHDGTQDDHHHAAIDISQDYLVNKASLLDPLALIIFFIGLFLFVPRLRRISSQWRYKAPTVKPCYYLLQPPLRAPPVY